MIEAPRRRAHALAATPTVLHVLLIEDDAEAAELITRAIAMAGYGVICQRVSTREAFQEALAEDRIDVIIADDALRRVDSVAAFVTMRDKGIDVPFLIVASGMTDVEASDAIRLGVHDVIPKASLARLGAVLARELDAADLRSSLRELRLRLQHSTRMAAIGQITLSVIHELADPLAVAIGNVTEMLQELEQPASNEVGVTPIPTSVSAPARRAADAMQRIVAMVQDLRGFAHPEGFRIEPVDLDDLIIQTCNFLASEIRHRARLKLVLGAPPKIIGDRAHLMELLANLILNASQAIPEGAAAANEIRITTKKYGDHVVVSVEDSGIGIAPELIPRTFEPFFTTKPPGVGAGMGLSVCSEIARQHGGTITARSQVGDGSRFDVTLPLESAFAAVGDPAASETQRNGGVRGRILLVEDEPQVRSTIARLLDDRHDVTAAASGEDALARLTLGETYDVILCDLMMPNLDGPALYEAAREVAPTSCPRFVFYTGGVFTPRVQRFVELIDQPVLDKPFDMVKLRAIIDTLTAVPEPTAPPMAPVLA